MRVLAAAALLAAVGCDRGPSARGLAPGQVRITFRHDTPTTLSGRTVLRCRIEYAGPRRFVEWRPELRIAGTSSATATWDRQVWKAPGGDAVFSVAPSTPTSAQWTGDFTFGSTTVGSTFGRVHPPAKTGVSIRKPPGDSVVVGEGEEIALFTLLADLPPALAEAPLADAEAAAAWTVRVVLRLAP